MGRTLTAPTVTEAARTLRRLGNDDVADMAVFPIGKASYEQKVDRDLIATLVILHRASGNAR
jgi:hypothetical protein